MPIVFKNDKPKRHVPALIQYFLALILTALIAVSLRGMSLLVIAGSQRFSVFHHVNTPVIQQTFDTGLSLIITASVGVLGLLAITILITYITSKIPVKK